MSSFTYGSSRCTNHLELLYTRREGSLFSVTLVIDKKPLVRFEPNGLEGFANWLEDNAQRIRQEIAKGEGGTGPVTGEGGM